MMNCKKNLLIIAVMLLSACSPITAQRGNLLTDDQLAKIKAGASTRDEVLSAWGPPTARAPFSEDTWYYIGESTERTAFFETDVIERRVVRVIFNDDNQVTSVAQKSGDDGMDIGMTEGTTPTAGYNISVMEQLLGNLGRPGLGQQQQR